MESSRQEGNREGQKWPWEKPLRETLKTWNWHGEQPRGKQKSKDRRGRIIRSSCGDQMLFSFFKLSATTVSNSSKVINFKLRLLNFTWGTNNLYVTSYNKSWEIVTNKGARRQGQTAKGETFFYNCKLS